VASRETEEEAVKGASIFTEREKSWDVVGTLREGGEEEVVGGRGSIIQDGRPCNVTLVFIQKRNRMKRRGERERGKRLEKKEAAPISSSGHTPGARALV
jgi:hypothetical protein